MRERRTDVDFNKHTLTVIKHDDLLVHTFAVPGTRMNSVEFINTRGIMAVTGDYGNWIFCREFHPSADGSASDIYWVQKLKISSCQDPYVFDSDQAKKEIKEIIEERDPSDEEKEWLEELAEAADEGEYNYIAKAMDKPSSFDWEGMPHGKVLNAWLPIIFDAFDEICRRIAASEELKKAKPELKLYRPEEHG